MSVRVLERLATELMTFRRARGLSQEAMAHRIGCSVPTYRSLERVSVGEKRVADPKLSTIMSVLATIELDHLWVHALRSCSPTEAVTDPA